MKQKILVIENEDVWRSWHHEALNADYIIKFANCIDTAYREINRYCFDFVILNINLLGDRQSSTDRKGFQLLNEMYSKKHPSRVIIVTGDKRIGINEYRDVKNIIGVYYKSFHLNQQEDSAMMKAEIKKHKKQDMFSDAHADIKQTTFGLFKNETHYAGVGCCCSYKGLRFLVTCSHVFKGKCLSIGDSITIFPFFNKNTKEPCIAKLLYISSPNYANDYYSSDEDIAVLSIPDNEHLIFECVEIKDGDILDGLTDFNSYTYSNGTLGDDVDKITIGGYRAAGYRLITCNGNNVLGQGDSGTIIHHPEHGFAGIFAKTDRINKKGYIIPKKTIIDYLKRITNDAKNDIY